MANNWKKTKEEIKTFRHYVEKLPAKAKEEAAYCYLITKEEIHRLLNQKGDGERLDGIRVYLGGQTIEGSMVPNIHVVACEKDGDGQYHDYNIGKEAPDATAANELSASLAKSSQVLLGDTRPCPTWCSQTNFLNS